MINDTITLDNTASQLGSYLTTPLADFRQICKPAPAKKNPLMPLEHIPIHTALDSAMPYCTISICAIGQRHNEKFKSKYTVSQSYIQNSKLDAREIIDKLCQEKVKEMRLELAKHAHYDLYNISVYLNGEHIVSMATENTDIDGEVYWISN